METMKRTKVVDAFDASLYGTKVNVKGWVRTRRGNKNVNFINGSIEELITELTVLPLKIYRSWWTSPNFRKRR